MEKIVRQGLSEIVSALMLILIVVAVGSLIFYNIASRASSQGKTLSREARALEERLLEEESLAILYAHYNTSSGELYVYVATGDYPVTVSAIYVDEELVWQGSYTLPTNTIAVIPPPQDRAIGLALTPGTVFQIKVATSKGVVKAAPGYAS